ncbi:MAG: hypothetical protein K2P84_07975, partial [Undibacterium sp.]|nr:hypothetical protein [Undibacterium sp.]
MKFTVRPIFNEIENGSTQFILLAMNSTVSKRLEAGVQTHTAPRQNAVVGTNLAYTDQRPSRAMQEGLQQMADGSPQTVQLNARQGMMDKSPSAIQLH